MSPLPPADRSPFDPAEFALRAAFEETHYWHVHRREVLRRVLAAHVPRVGEARFADVGCGIGTVATHLNASGFRVDYVDLHAEALALAERRARERLGTVADERRFLRADVRQPLPLTDLDGVLLLDVIEHLEDDVAALRHARAALAPGPGALVVCTVPAFSFLWSPWDTIERHRRRYTRRQLEASLRAAGLAPVWTSYFFAPLFFAALGVKALRAARHAITPPPPARDIRDLVETTSHPALDRAMLALTGPERSWLPRGRLPLGTSLLAIARPVGQASA